MTKFKAGDLLECINTKESHTALTLGKKYRALEGTDHSFVNVTMDNGGVGGMNHWRFKLSGIQGPIRIVTRKEIIGGDYGKVHVSTYDDTRTRIGIDSIMNAVELTEAIETLTAIRDALLEAE